MKNQTELPAQRVLYPRIEPYESRMLPVSDLHSIYFEQSGNPDGKPVVFIHGGPGGGTIGMMRRFFDPDAYRIILFDQRGCGRSIPHACLEENTTWDLVADMERLRCALEIERWLLFGGSWGSTLALAYAQKHPARVSGFVLRGIFTVRSKELRWFYQEGASAIFPDAWESFVQPIPKSERDDLLGAYHRRLTSDDVAIQIEAARAWSLWEGSTSRLVTDAVEVAGFGEDAFALAFSRIESHYFVNRGFFDSETELLDGVSTIAHLPCVIVQGRYDVVCPMETAFELHRRWPRAEFRIAAKAGHSAFEPDITSELVRATDGFRQS